MGLGGSSRPGHETRRGEPEDHETRTLPQQPDFLQAVQSPVLQPQVVPQQSLHFVPQQQAGAEEEVARGPVAKAEPSPSAKTVRATSRRVFDFIMMF